MSEADQPFESPNPPDVLPRRAATFFGRLAQAFREQYWAAVMFEIGIVVTGVLISFQVTAWGQARSGTAKEQTYLRQLSADLHETVRMLEEADSLRVRGDRGSAMSVSMVYLPEAPPADSLIRWNVQSTGTPNVTPLLGSAEALISSSDLGLIRDDSLRSAITACATRSRQLIDDQTLHHTEWRQSVDTMMTRMGYLNHLDYFLLRDSSWEDHPMWPGASGPRRDPFALDVDDLLQDRDALTVINRILQRRLATRQNHRDVQSATTTLLERVEQELGPSNKPS